jgi:hypothetical protein
MLRRLLLCLLICPALMPAATGVAGAAPAMPAWKIDAVSAPTNFPRGETPVLSYVMYHILVTDVGGAPSDGTPVTITDTLPHGVTLDTREINLTGTVGAFKLEDPQGEEDLPCSDGPPIVCTVSGFRTGQSWEMLVPVQVEADAPPNVTNIVSVSGGGAASVSVSEPTTVSETQPIFGFTGLGAASLDDAGGPVTQAGSHPYEMTVDLNLNTIADTPSSGSLAPAGNPKTITANLPAGVVANPNAATRCSESQLESFACPDSSAVGVISLTIGQFGFPSVAPSPLYNMVPPPGVPAEFGFNATGLGIFVHLFGGIRTGGDYGLSASSHDILQFGDIIGIAVTLWGNPSDPSHDEARGRCAFENPIYSHISSCPGPSSNIPFLTLPSACSGVLGWGLSSESWQNPGVFIEDSFTSEGLEGAPEGVTGCGRVPFNPSLSVQPSVGVAGASSGLSVDVGVPQNENVEELAEATLKKTVVSLPQGVVVSPSAANGLGACTPEEIGLHNALKPSCPDASKVGSVEASTPLLQGPLSGSVYVAEQGDNPFGSLLALYLVVEGSGVLIKLPGEVHLDPSTGQVTASFDNIPQQPVSSIHLRLFGGPRAALMLPSACGTYGVSSQLTPWSSETPVVRQNAFAVNEGCGAEGFSPAFVAGTADNEAGAFSAFSVSFSRQDNEQDLSGASITAPEGLLGVLKGVERCPEPQASEGACGAGSLIGHAAATAGPGPDAVTVQGGEVFLTGPYKGAPFGLSIVVPAVAGPFDLGNVVVRAAVGVDSRTAQISIVSDPLPRILQGVPLDIRSVDVTVDRAGFTFNPTDCEPLSVTGTLTSTQGAAAGVSSRFQAANCATLPFKPVFKAATQAGTSKRAGASLDVRVASTGGQANIHAVAVTLPKQLPARLTTIQQACLASVFDANPARCPAASNIGTATASTPAFAASLTGPAYLVSHGGAAFPDLVVILQGEGVTLELTGSIDIKHGVTSSAFEGVPDAPISSFELKLPEGPHSGLAAVVPASAKGSLCGQALKMPTTLTGQNGVVLTQTTSIAVTGCPKAKKKTKTKPGAKGPGRGGK